MPILIETIQEQKYRQGKIITYVGSGTDLMAGTVADVIIQTGSKEVDLREISLTASGTEEISWQAFGEPIFTPNTQITPVVRNTVPAVKREVKAYLNPTIASAGTALFALPILVIAQLGAGNRNFIDDQIVENPFKLLANSTYLIRFTNTGTLTAKFTITMDLWLA